VALILDSADRSEEACAYWRKALARNEKLWGRDSFAVGVNLENLAASETIVGDFAAAVADDERALSIFEHRPGAESKDIALGEASLADIFVEELRPREAEALARKAAAAWKDIAPRSFEYAQAEEILGAALLDEGRFADAREAYESSAAARDMDEKKDPFVVLTLLGLGAAHLGQGDAAGALAPLERAVRVESSGVKLEVAACKLLLGEALARTSGDRGRARQLVTEARAVYAVSGKGPRHDRDLAAMDTWLATNPR
jgi:tetratricopeptide (TPR) repeat protein